MSQRLGRPAEDEFKWLCSQAQVTCNRSSEDDYGWDFIVETPAPPDSGLPADKAPAPKPLLVQVKWTGGKFARTTMKVSNALVLAKSELPCFVVLFHEYDGEMRIYAQQFGRELIGRALKCGRQVTAAHRPPHKSTMAMSFTHADDHSDDLVHWLTTTVTGLPKEYGAEKRSLCESLGYEGRNYRAEVTLGPLKGVEELVDHQLGLTDYLPASHVTVIDSRFGIDAPSPVVEGTNAKIQIRPNNAQECRLVLQSSSGEVVSLPGTMKSPVIPGLPADKFKVLVETCLFKMTIDLSGGMTVAGHELLGKKLPMERLVDVARLVSWSGQPISVRMLGDGIPTLSWDGNVDFGGDKKILVGVLGIAETLRDIQFRSGLSDVQLAWQDLVAPFGQLSIVHEVLTAKDLEFGWVEEVGLKYEGGISRVLGYFDIEVGGVAFFTVFDAPVNEETMRGGQISLKCGRPVLRDCFVGQDRDDVRAEGRACYGTHENSHDDDWLSVGDLGSKLWN